MSTISLKKWMGLVVVALLSFILFCQSQSGEPGSSGKSELVTQLESVFYDANFGQVPQTVFAAVDYGAVADGETINTKQIQSAIDAASAAGGGIVTLPVGTVFSGALFLKSNVELRLDEGVVLKAVNKDEEFPDKWTRIAGIEMDWPAALINIYQVENAHVTGKGMIDGNGEFWWNKFFTLLEPYTKQNMRWAVDYDAKRVRPIVVYESKNVRLTDFTVKRSGFWTVTMTYSERVYVKGLVIRNNIGGHGPSTDGIDIDSSQDILVEDCDIDCNDDNFCLKAGRDADGLRVNRPAENIVVRNCITGKGHGLITLGSETSGGMHNIEVYGLDARGTNNGIRFKSAKVRGGVISNVWFHDIKMDSVKNPFHWELNWFPEYSYPPRPEHIPEPEWPAHWKAMLTKVDPPERGIPEFYDIQISDVTATNAGIGIYANAYEEKPIRDVVWEHVSIDAQNGGKITNAVNWKMDDVSLRARTPIQVVSCKNVELPEEK